MSHRVFTDSELECFDCGFKGTVKVVTTYIYADSHWVETWTCPSCRAHHNTEITSPFIFVLDYSGAEEGSSGLYGPFESRDKADAYASLLAAVTPDQMVSWNVSPVRIVLDVRRLTGFLDADGVEVCEGDLIRVPIEDPYQDVHGTWSEKRVVFRNGMWIGEYFRSEKGQILPVGYGAQELKTMLDETGSSSKERFFTQHDRYRTLTATVVSS